ncbi:MULTISPECIES: integrase arm-type DNA-binding domain-containing protein [unclassified Herbaspirillum]|uniref:tyrosine-type recombinase/integrase n=1 Tax=unclassified Herbaspirillum TaxID=2624150 RepID=UPI001150F073|nr:MULTISPECIES: integrase arm-type DNA-binding domain-containing protein [unclassified Herbaspirillum]MBB5393053.1 integrase [Herbaspirillum sp. SJZ102]TQK04304.1 integrase [Herbaspirillum sp. SJZ130]TQK09911.1 integrase [Herbaspirillum sp. SJZ106]
MPLTDTACRQAKAQDKPQKLVDGTGMYLLVNKTGKYWRWDYRFEGKRKTMALGVYPDVSLAQAREKHQAARKILIGGVDPMADRKVKKDGSRTFETIARRWHAHWAPARSLGHAAQTLRRLEIDVFPDLGRKLMDELTASSFRDMAQKIEKRGALDIARRALQTCGQIMRYAVANDLAERNPVADVRPADVLKPRKKRNYARVDAKELPILLRAIDGYVGGIHTRLALQLMALTFVRTSELIGATWAEFDMQAKRWNIPAERMKMDTPHVVPLSRQALALLEEIKKVSFGSDYLFPGERDQNKSMSNNTILYALYRLGYRGRMTGHGFRGVASTILHEQGYQHEHIELQLAHTERNEVSAAYNHALYLPQRARMMQDWADYLDRMRFGAEVIPLSRQA